MCNTRLCYFHGLYMDMGFPTGQVAGQICNGTQGQKAFWEHSLEGEDTGFVSSSVLCMQTTVTVGVMAFQGRHKKLAQLNSTPQ